MTKIIAVGLGAMGSLISSIALEKKEIQLVGAVVRRKELHGTDLSQYLQNDLAEGVKIYPSIIAAAQVTQADLAVIATGSFVRDEFSQIEEAISQGLNVISIAEEMAYPQTADKALAEKMDQLAKANNVTVLGTGINPGFVLDLLIVTLTGISRNVDSIYAERVNDLAPYGKAVMATQGVGITREAFESGIQDGSVVGHIGFPQSVMMISDALDLEIDEVIETKKPIIAQKLRTGKYITVEPGLVAGCTHTVIGKKNGRTFIELVHPQQIEPGAEDQKTWDLIQIKGTPSIDLRIDPELAGGTGTAAIAVNMAPLVNAAEPGLKSMVDLPVPRLAALKK